MKSAMRLAGIMVLALTASAANAQQHIAHSVSPHATSPEADKQAIQSTITGFENAFGAFDFDLVDSDLTPDARWIEDSEPSPARRVPQFFRDAKAAGMHIEYRIHDMSITLNGDTAWVTLTLNGTFRASTPAARVLLGNSDLRTPTYVESEVLMRTPSGWKIALGHTTCLRGGWELPSLMKQWQQN